MPNPYESTPQPRRDNRQFLLGFVFGSIFVLAGFMGGLFAGWMAIAFLAFGSG